MNQPDTTTRHDGRRLVLDAGLGASIVLSVLSGLVVYYLVVHFTLGTESPSRQDYVAGIGVMLMSMLLLGLAVGVLRWLRAAPWTYVLTAIGVALDLIVLGSCAVQASVARPEEFTDYTFVDALVVTTWIPTNWPLMLFILVGLFKLLTTPLSPGPAALRDR
jgi:hypothetical protein